ncbi:hypothetical protein [Vallicoccus soli]|uniref:Uncharacterized protein n=1 Tax=Vallicoccus soli TaxID=2339232 RepID=A0A3A3Z462_9ACTN|nr:hypothetical protein [Vallicoccus soli]RJK95337.1 hypothetical protein D5H78_11770 [Vallicoccus soli]
MSGAVRAAADRLLAPGTRSRAVAGALIDKVVAPLAGDPAPGLRGASDDGERVVLVLVRGATADRVAEVVERVQEARRVLGGFVPVLLVDGRAFVPVRRAGLVAEQVPAGGPALADALAERRRTYGTDLVVVVGEGAPAPDVALLDGLLRPVPRGPRAPAPVRRLARRLERAFDRPGPG